MGAPAGLRPPPRPAGPPAPVPPRPRPPEHTAGEHSALTALPPPTHPLARQGRELPTAALPTTESEGAAADTINDLATSNAAADRRPPPVKRQDTPTEMFVQEVHGTSLDDDDDDGGRTSVARPLDDDDDPRTGIAGPPAAGSPAVAKPEPPPRPSYPASGADDDNPTSILDLDALNEQQEQRRKAQAGPGATTPPPPIGASGIGLPDLDPAPGPRMGPPGTQTLGTPALGAPALGTPGLHGLPPGASDTMRLDLDGITGTTPRPNIGRTTEKMGEVFDPSRVALVDAPGAKAPDALETAVQARPALPHASGAPTTPLLHAGAPTAVMPPTGKPEWQTKVDQGIKAVTAQGIEATGRFLGWYRALQPNEQIAFVAGSVLGFVIVVMLFILWIR